MGLFFCDWVRCACESREEGVEKRVMGQGALIPRQFGIGKYCPRYLRDSIREEESHVRLSNFRDLECEGEGDVEMN
jgi:hypothetical protein